MSWVSHYAKSSIGAKAVMAVSGVLLLGFVIFHMLGNLQLFAGLNGWEAGQKTMNDYAAFMQSLGVLLWVARIGLLVLVVAHIASAFRLTALNNRARPNAYHQFRPKRTGYAARTMIWSGVIVLAFIVFHLLHFTLGVTHPVDYGLQDAAGRHDVYSMVVLGFRSVPVAAFYLIAMALLSLHLSHGVSSACQSLGLNHPKYNGLFRLLGPASGALIFVGNAAIVVACLVGVLPLPPGVA